MYVSWLKRVTRVVCVWSKMCLSWALAGGDGYNKYCLGTFKIIFGDVNLKRYSW